MRFMVVSDIEGVTGVSTYAQATNSDFGQRMLMHDLNAVLRGINASGEHEIVVYDMHTDGRNIRIDDLPKNVSVVMGKPVTRNYHGCTGHFDGLFLVGFHAMADRPHTLLSHTFLLDYQRVSVNGVIVGEVGMEAFLAASLGIPLLFVSGDDAGCAEASALESRVVTVPVKASLDDAQALCYAPAYTAEVLVREAERAARSAGTIPPVTLPAAPYTIRLRFYEGALLDIMRLRYGALFEDSRTAVVEGDALLDVWMGYLAVEREMQQALSAPSRILGNVQKE